MKTIKQLAKNAFNAVKSLYEREPARVIAGVLAVLSAVGVVLDFGTVAYVFAILFGGEVVRQQVTPAKKVEKQIAAAKREAKKPAKKR